MNMLSLALYCIVGLMFLCTSSILLWAYFSSKGVYDDYIEPLDEKVFKLKKLLGIGLFLNQRINLNRFIPKIAREVYIKYSNNIRGRITELYGYRYSEYYSAVHSGSKWSIFMLGSFVMIVFGIIKGINSGANSAITFAILSPIVGFFLAFLLDKELNDKIDQRRLEIQMDFPEFVSKVLLLVNAGMTISRAWEKVVTDNKKNSPLYNELNVSLAEIRAGRPEAVAYEDFARRCKIREVIKFVSVIILNLKKGGAEVVPTLRIQVEECWEMRKNAARRLGEQASTKLMLPMAIMLLGIIMIVALPAVLQLMN